jgi:hypothetical protein
MNRFYALGDYRDTPLEVDDSKPHRIVATTVKPLFGIRMLQVTVYRYCLQACHPCLGEFTL